MRTPSFCTSLPMIVLLAAVLGGCAYSIEAEHEQPPPEPVTLVVVGTIDGDDTDRQREIRHFRRALVTALAETGAFRQVLSVPPQPFPADAIRVTGHFGTVSDGSEGLRFVIGYGAGAPRLRATFIIADAAGNPLATFRESRRFYGGTSWAGHYHPADLDDLTEDFADRTARAIARWSRQAPIGGGVWEQMETAF